MAFEEISLEEMLKRMKESVRQREDTADDLYMMVKVGPYDPAYKLSDGVKYFKEVR